MLWVGKSCIRSLTCNLQLQSPTEFKQGIALSSSLQGAEEAENASATMTTILYRSKGTRNGRSWKANLTEHNLALISSEHVIGCPRPGNEVNKLDQIEEHNKGSL